MTEFLSKRPRIVDEIEDNVESDSSVENDSNAENDRNVETAKIVDSDKEEFFDKFGTFREDRKFREVGEFGEKVSTMILTDPNIGATLFVAPVESVQGMTYVTQFETLINFRINSFKKSLKSAFRFRLNYLVVSP